MRNRHIWILIMFAAACASAQNQWLDHPAPGVPRTRDGKVNLFASAPRSPDGKPDLSGVWQANGSPARRLAEPAAEQHCGGRFTL